MNVNQVRAGKFKRRNLSYFEKWNNFSENQVAEEALTHEGREGSKVSSSEKDPTPSIADSNEGVFTEPSTPSMNDKKKYAKRPAIANKVNIENLN